MRLVVKQTDRPFNEFRFTEGPVHIGRHTHSQVFLPDLAVSRQHAVIFKSQDGKWMVEDLGSANKTYLNDEAIHRAEIKTGDCLRIAGFTIEVNFADDTQADKSIHLEDTLAEPSAEQQVLIRMPGIEQASPIKLPAKRAKDFLQATESICKADGLDEVLRVLIRVALSQFSAYHVWCALRNQRSGPMTCNAGKQRDGQSVQLSEIKLKEKITHAVEKGQFLLLPRLPAKYGEERLNSVMIAPVVSQNGCFGVIYIDNAMDHEHYSLSDLDYLMLLSIHAASVLENF